MSTTAWCLYLNLSRRVRVTFESTDKDDRASKRLTIASTADPAEVIRTEGLYAKHAEQFDTPSRDHGLYTRLLIELNGNESAARLAYIKSKVERESPTQHVGPPPPESSETRAHRDPNSIVDLSKPFEYRKNHWETVGIVLLIFAVGGVVINALSPPHQAIVQDGPQTTPELRQQSSLPVEPQDAIPDIPAEVESEFNRRFPEWSTPERRALLQAKINEIDQRTDKEGKARFSDAVVMELARIELVREGNSNT